MADHRAFLHYTGGVPFDDFVLLVREPLLKMGYKIVHIEEDRFDRPSFFKEDIFVGSIDLTKKFFERVGIAIPKPLDFSEGLGPYYGRDIIRTTWGEVKGRTEFPFFVKPANSVKLFVGSLIEKESHKFFFHDVADNEEIFVQGDIGEILSEYRVFVHNKKPVDIRRYKGDPFIFPPFATMSHIMKFISCLDHFPISYTIDIAVMEDKLETTKSEGNTEFMVKIVEFNDMWSIGSYGMDPLLYTKCLHSRWRQIMTSK